MTFLDFFAGIGGFRLGLEQAGHKCIGFCEYDKFAVMSYVIMHTATEKQREYLKTLSFKDRQKEVLKDEYKNGEWYANDIRDVRTGDVPKADIWCFGFPCQDISIAGNQRGFAGERSSLFFRIMRLAGDQKEENKLSILLIENVKNLLSVNGGRDFARLLICMDENGYDAEWQVINSNMPVADVAPMKHGKWIWNPHGMDWGLGAWQCSECHNRNSNLPMDNKINPLAFSGSKYCPNCGAKMDLR